jgi:hypothetical protein
MTVTCMGCEAYINDDLLEDACCQSGIVSYSDITSDDADNDYIMADEAEVWVFAYKEIYLPTIFTPSWDFPTFDHFVALSVRSTFFDRQLSEAMSEEFDEEYAELILDW